MKKLSVILLTTVFVLGLAVRVNAQVTDGVDRTAFDGDQVITFDDVPSCTLIENQYYDEFAVSFSGGLHGETILAPFVMSTLNPASNFNTCDYVNEAGTEGLPIMVTFEKPVTRVGFDGHSPQGGIITVTPFRGGVAMATVSQDESKEEFIGIEDPEGIDAIKIEGDGSYGKLFITWIDNLTFGGTPDTGPTEIPVTTVTINVKPPNCLGASINMKSQGVTPVVIAGSLDFDVTTIDSSSVRLNGVAPVRTSIEDVPLCGSPVPDGSPDLTLKFNTPDLVRAMEDFLQEGETLENDDMVVLELSGNLLEEWGGAPIEGEDTVTVLDTSKDKKGKDKKGKDKANKKHKHKHKKVKNRHGWIR